LESSDGRRYFTFVAQSLDNRSPDIISAFGVRLSSDDLRSPERTGVIGMTTTISAHGKKFQASDRSPSQGFILERDVLFHIGTEDKDVAGRAAPLLCLGKLDEPDPRFWREVLLAELDEFAGQARRTIGLRQLSDFAQLLDIMLASRSPGLGGSLVRAVAGALGGGRDKKPVLPGRAAAVVVATAADKRALAVDTQLAGLLGDPSVAIVEVPVPDDEPQTELVRRLGQLGMLDSSPTIAVRDPYDADRYLRADDLSEELVRSKQGCYQALCKLLGAKSVITAAEVQYTYKGHRQLKVGALATIRNRGVKAGAGTETDDSNVMTQRAELRQENAGAPPDIAAAEAFIRDRGLDWDRDLIHLLDTVRSAHNPPKRLRLSYNTRQAMDRVTRRFGNIAAAGAKLSADGGTNANCETVYECTVEVEF
jgi:hypothetical protein